MECLTQPPKNQEFQEGPDPDRYGRGVYVVLFPNHPLWGIVWPTLWFALWHYRPGSVSPLTGVRTLMMGAGVYGALLGWLAYKISSIRWAATSHTLAGLAQALN